MTTHEEKLLSFFHWAQFRFADLKVYFDYGHVQFDTSNMTTADKEEFEKALKGVRNG